MGEPIPCLGLSLIRILSDRVQTCSDGWVPPKCHVSQEGLKKKASLNCKNLASDIRDPLCFLTDPQQLCVDSNPEKRCFSIPSFGIEGFLLNRDTCAANKALILKEDVLTDGCYSVRPSCRGNVESITFSCKASLKKINLFTSVW